MNKRFFLSLALLAVALSLYANDAKAIVDKMEDVMDFDSISFSATMRNHDKLGVTALSFDAIQRGDGDTLLSVTSGLDKGQKILRLDDDIYIYYPDADEIIRLSDSGLKNSFLGSDFSYEDLTGDDDYEDRYDYELVGEETFNGIPCYKIQYTAKKLSETYQRMEMLIDKERYVPLKESLYSKSGKLLKDIYFDDFTDEEPLYPMTIKTENAIKKSNYSELTISKLKFNIKLDESKFDKEELSW